MKKTLLILVSVLMVCMTSCGKKREPLPPDNLIPRSQMIDIMVDAWIMESAIHEMIHRSQDFEPVTVSLYVDFFEKHDITKDQFTQSIDYYMNGGQAEIFVKDCKKRLEERKLDFTEASIPDSLPQ